MSAEYEGQDPLKLAQQAERDLNSDAMKQGSSTDTTSANSNRRTGASDSTAESGVDESVTNKFPGSEVTYGSAASGAGDNREIPESEGGSINPTTGQPTKARDFEGAGGPEEKAQIYAQNQGGNDDVRGNVRQGGDTVRPS